MFGLLLMSTGDVQKLLKVICGLTGSFYLLCACEEEGLVRAHLLKHDSLNTGFA